MKTQEQIAGSLAFEIVAINVTNEFGGDFDVNAIFADKRKKFSATNAKWWIENRF